MAVNGAILELTREYNWEQFGAETPAQAAALMETMFYEYVQDSVCMLGAITPFVTADPPSNSIECDGSTHSREDYPALYEILDSVFIVDADNFRVPDLRGRTVIGIGEGTGLSERTMDEIGGAETVTLTEAQLATHTHTTQPHTHINTPHSHTEIGATTTAVTAGAGLPVPSAVVSPSITGASGVVIDNATVTVDSTGGDEAHENMPPFIALRYCIIAR